MEDLCKRYKREEKSITPLVQQLSDLDEDFTKIRRKLGKTSFFLGTFIASPPAQGNDT